MVRKTLMPAENTRRVRPVRPSGRFAPLRQMVTENRHDRERPDSGSRL